MWTLGKEREILIYTILTSIFLAFFPPYYLRVTKKNGTETNLQFRLIGDRLYC